MRVFFKKYRGIARNKVRTFKFTKCNFPQNLSLYQVLSGYEVSDLVLDGYQQSAPPSWLLRNLTELEDLTIKNYNLSHLPEDLFVGLIHLKRLSLDNNNIEILPDHAFRDLGELEELSLYNNSLESLSVNVFQGLKNLQKLELRRNRFTSVPSEALRPLVSLKVLRISGNRINSLRAGQFEGNAKLTEIELIENPLQNVSPETFENNTSLMKLDLSNGWTLSSLPEKLFFSLNALTELNISSCNLSAIPENLLTNAFNLTRLNLENNRIEKIPSKLFTNCISLSYLNLENNSIDSLPDDVFLKTTELKYLSLAQNTFRNLPSQALKYLESVEELNFEGNMVRELKLDTLPNLLRITLRNNEIDKLDDSLFEDTQNLEYVDLSFNRLTEFPDLQWTMFLRLQTLKLNNNLIQKLEIPYIQSENVTIYLENNNISWVSTEGIEKIENNPIYHGNIVNAQNVHLKNNPLQCDCNMLAFIKYLKNEKKRLALIADVQDLVCSSSSPGSPANLKVSEVKEEDLVCLIRKQCAKECRCFVRATTQTTEVECPNEGLKDLPVVIPSNTTILRIQNNSLTSLTGLADLRWRNLKELNVGDNQVTSEGLYFTENLTTLFVRGNALTVVSPSLANWLTKAEQVTLAGNKWMCDCHGLTLRNSLSVFLSKVADAKEVSCAAPGSLLGRLVLELKDGDLCPASVPSTTKYIVVICLCVFFGVLTLALSVLYYRNRKLIVAYVYIHYYKIFSILFREKDMDEDKPFHAFVSYSSSDSQVARTMVQELEGDDGRFRLCIHERDWLPGQLITWNIVRSVQNSRRTILVLSQDFLKSVWFQLEFHVAYHQMLEDKVDRLIVVVCGDLPDKKDMDEDLKVLLSTKTYLIWNERWFWEKLKYAMPHTKSRQGERRRRAATVPEPPSPELLQKIEDKLASLTQEEETTGLQRIEVQAETVL